MLVMSSRVNDSRKARMCAPALPQMASSTHWPSWSQAPWVWGSLKSPATIGPSTRSGIDGFRQEPWPGCNRPRPRAWTAPARRPSGPAGSARGRAGVGRSVWRYHEQRLESGRHHLGQGTARLGSHSRPGSIPSQGRILDRGLRGLRSKTRWQPQPIVRSTSHNQFTRATGPSASPP